MVERFLPRRAWGIFRRYPTTENLIAFKRAKAFRRIYVVNAGENLGSSMCLQSHRQLPVNSYGKGQSSEWPLSGFNIPILETSTALYSSPLDVANLIGKTFASVSSSDSYSPAFQATKNRLERTPINFQVPTTFTI
ncbi:putative RNA-directed DNA polymerase from transposon X-element [Trichonephila clavipes]|nr:putative RNA-directed DNA polymerase from transposon X-element [Trichonephila clavipes]